MGKQKYDLIDVVEDISKVNYSIGVFLCNFFYKVSNLEDLKESMDAYIVSRFSQRVEDFTHEHNKLTSKEKKAFYDDLTSNKQNLNYLYEFIEQTRTTTYDLHAKLLARLSVELVKNKNLDYYEMSLLSNMNILNELDIIKIYKELKKIDFSTDTNTIFEIITYEDYCTFNKCIQLGFFEHIVKNSNNVFVGNNAIVQHERAMVNKIFRINNFTKRLLDMLCEILESN